MVVRFVVKRNYKKDNTLYYDNVSIETDLSAIYIFLKHPSMSRVVLSSQWQKVRRIDGNTSNEWLLRNIYIVPRQNDEPHIYVD